MSSELSYAKAFKELQQLVEDLQAEAVDIDQLSAKAKRAAELIAFCRVKLRQTTEDVNSLFDGKEG